MDIRMPGVDGIEATRRITGDDDLAGVKVIVLTTFEVDEHVVDAIRAGASGFVGKGIEPADLLDAIRVVADGEALLSPHATRAMLAAFAHEQAAPGRPPIDDSVLAVLTPGSGRSRRSWPTASPTTRSPSACSCRRSRRRPTPTGR
jgi:DNA-binding NarL/FixJ family response regulator